jgi:site-specific DNA-methyltransferase (adenine-specific)
MTKVGRPPKHPDKKTRWRKASKAYRRRHRPVTPRTARKRAEQAAREAQATGELCTVSPTVTLLCKAIADITDDDVAPGSLDAIITDPPYSRAFLHLYDALGRFAARYLKPGGTLATQHGDVYLDEVLRRLGAQPGLDFQAQLLWHLQGAETSSSMHTGYSYFTKSVLVYRKPPWAPLRYNQSQYWSLPHTAARTAHHAWGQEAAGIAEILKRVTTPGMVVCDPFLGGGTTALVALEHHCAFIGIDKDPAHIETVKARLAAYRAAEAAA